MNDETQSEPMDEPMRRAIERVCDEFESAWRKDQAFTIEQILPRLDELVRPFAMDASASDVIEPILMELIHVEMDLRNSAKMEVDKYEYYRRFPDYESVIDASIKRIKQLANDDLESESKQDVTVCVEQKSDAGDSDEFSVVEQGKKGLPQELGRFVEISEIGKGGYGIVCRATDRVNGTQVALKFPRKKVIQNNTYLRQFLQEAERVMKLDHPGIVKTLSIEQIDGYLVTVQQLIPGTDLKKSIEKTRGQIEIAELIAEIAVALAYANRQGIVHRDLKPANILLNESGRPFIGDFGLALDDDAQLGAANVRCGTVPYMSPQLAAGLVRNLDGRTDIWSLGVILYELLVGQRPFRGKTHTEIYEQIETRDPKPLRQINGDVAPELERICLKCLERRACDRYATADDLADDLRHWIGQPRAKVAEMEQADFVPKGLRSYTAEDSSFFLDLLPGPRNRDGIPSSIRFWKSRICEPVSDENCVPVGVIYGPSGSGKSSFVKAGLVPQLNHGINAIYVEATHNDTEVRTIKALRRRFPEIPSDISLPDLFAGLIRGKWQASDKKILIVMDQFEQRLSISDDFQQSQLAKALRHCDGVHLQCLWLVRDDFWLALTRFADVLEMDLREGQNSQMIDLFDSKHATNVLTKLGQAYDCLPENPSELSGDQASFLKRAVEQLTSGNYVICVRLTLFAEMFKTRPWSTAELKSVGGASGVGEKFLEETFGEGNTSRRFQLQRESVQAVLEALLPESGSDIRGAMKSEQELMSAARLENRPEIFKRLIKTLDSELRLITRTDPDTSGEMDNTAADRSKTVFYQLTHDYLVPSVRKWLSTELSKTRGGRARIRLRELAAQVVPDEPIKYPPTHLEWASWQFLKLGGNYSDRERTVLQHGLRRFLTAALLVFIPLLLSIFLLLESQNQRFVNSTIDAIQGQGFEQTLDLADRLKGNNNRTVTLLRQRLQSLSKLDEPYRRLRLALFLKTNNNSIDEWNAIIDDVTSIEIQPTELQATVSVFEKLNVVDKKKIGKRVTACLYNSNLDSAQRMRAAVFLALSSTLRETVNWESQSRLIASSLQHEPVTNQANWIKLFESVSSTLSPMFLEIFNESSEFGRCYSMALALFSFSSKDDPGNRNSFFQDLILESSDVQLDAILSVFETQKAIPVIRTAMERVHVSKSRESTINRSIALFRCGNPTFLKELLVGNDVPEIRSLAIIRTNHKRIRFETARTLFTKAKELFQNNADYRQSVLMIFAEFAAEMTDPTDVDWTVRLAERICNSEKDSGCYAAAELIVRRLDGNLDEIRKKRLGENPDGVLGNVFISKTLIPFSIVAINGEKPYRLAVAMYETSIREFEHMDDPATPNDFSRPFVFSRIQDVFRYCNDLSVREELDQGQLCYSREQLDQIGKLIISDESQGFRLPTSNEWKQFSGIQSNKASYFGEDNFLSSKFAWSAENSTIAVQPVGELLPNRIGSFDIFGNAGELCTSRTPAIATDSIRVSYFSHGNTVRQTQDLIAQVEGYEIPEVNFFNPDFVNAGFFLSFRVVRRLD